MKNVIQTNDYSLRDSRDILINLGDLVALATPNQIKTGRVIGFKAGIEGGNYDSIPATVVVQCHEGYKPSFVRYSKYNILCFERLGEGAALS